ncbi:FHA domain-containing protein FhaB/FipA [Georgenia satyanarayanai]|uniref:FHA domain-containing protein FhaB/FipA n=1 Tax=Georgenia satyanarayanai TaxID=860221 RepID=UPI001264114D|nr:FHA domain-containing protein [Georgenia satyanarayanai]
MTELAVTLLRLSYLVLLWVFVLGALAVLRRDIFGTRITRRSRGDAQRGRRPTPPAPKRPTRSTPTRLVVTQGPLTGTTMPLGPSAVVVGRAPSSTLVLDDDYSSGRHARFYPQDGAWWVEDLGSTNGTFVGDQRLTQPVQLTAGTPVRVGQTIIELQR